MNKAELLDKIRSEHQRLERLVQPMGDEEMTAPGVVGKWSVKDVLAHISAWERLLPGWLAAARAGTTPHLPRQAYTWDDVDKLNKVIYETSRGRKLDKVKAEFKASFQMVLREVDRMSEEDLSDPQRFAWMDGKPLASLIAADTYEHYAEFADHIQEWTQVQGGG